MIGIRVLLRCPSLLSWLDVAHALGRPHFAASLGLSNHTELRDQVECLLHVQVQRLQGGVDAHIVFVEPFALGNSFQSFDGPANELGNVINSGEDLGVRVFLDEFKQLSIDNFNAGNFVSVLIKNLVFAKHFVLFVDVLLRKCLLKFITSLLQLLDQLIKSLIYVFRLLVVQSLDFLLDVLDELPVVIIDALCVEHEFVEVVDVLLDNVRNIIELCKLVAVVVAEHTFWTHDSVAELAEVFNLLVLMLEAVYLARPSLGH